MRQRNRSRRCGNNGQEQLAIGVRKRASTACYMREREQLARDRPASTDFGSCPPWSPWGTSKALASLPRALAAMECRQRRGRRLQSQWARLASLTLATKRTWALLFPKLRQLAIHPKPSCRQDMVTLAYSQPALPDCVLVRM
jgi:hypothetical protein